MIKSDFEVRFLDRPKPVKLELASDKNGVFTAEAVVRAAATIGLQAKPASLELFVLKSGWLILVSRNDCCLKLLFFSLLLLLKTHYLRKLY